MPESFCWRCRVVVPVLSHEIYAYIIGAYEAGADALTRRSGIVERYREITGFDETAVNAIHHHVEGCFGPPCPNCRLPLRSADAAVCPECAPAHPQDLIFAEVAPLVAEVLQVLPERLHRSHRFLEDLGADSLDMLEIITSAEERFGIILEDEEVEAIRTVGDLVASCAAHRR